MDHDILASVSKNWEFSFLNLWDICFVNIYVFQILTA